MTIADDLYHQVQAIDRDIELPAVRSFHLPPAQPIDPDDPYGPSRICNNFAALILADGTVGMTYTAIDDALAGLQRELPRLVLAGKPVIEVASLYRQAPGWQRSLGLSAINAISQYVLGRDRARWHDNPDTLAMLDIQAGDNIGMVGLFGRLVDPIRQAGATLTVIELDPRHVRREPGLIVTLDPAELAGCNKVLITGTTLLNLTLDSLLERLTHAQCIAVIGPTASCLPEPLFARGVTRVGGAHIESIDQFMALWRSAGRWRESGTRYRIDRPG